MLSEWQYKPFYKGWKYEKVNDIRESKRKTLFEWNSTFHDKNPPPMFYTEMIFPKVMEMLLSVAFFGPFVFINKEFLGLSRWQHSTTIMESIVLGIVFQTPVPSDNFSK